MTLAHAQSYLARLRQESLDRAARWYSKKQAVKLRDDAYEAAAWGMTPPSVISQWTKRETLAAYFEWSRLRLRIYDESQRLRAIAEGHK